MLLTLQTERIHSLTAYTQKKRESQSCCSSRFLRLWHRPYSPKRATPKPTPVCIYTLLYIIPMDVFVTLLFDYKFRNCQIPGSQEQSVKYAFLYIATLVSHPLPSQSIFSRQHYDEIFLDPARAVLAIRLCRARLRCKISTKRQESRAKLRIYFGNMQIFATLF